MHARSTPAVMLNEPTLGVGAAVAVGDAVALLADAEADTVRRAGHRRRHPRRTACPVHSPSGRRLSRSPTTLAVVVDHLAHRALDRRRAVAAHELEHPLARHLHAGDLRAQLKRHQPGQARAPHPGIDHVLADRACVDELHRRQERGLRVDVARLLDEAAGLDAAELALVDHVVDPREQAAFDEHRARRRRCPSDGSCRSRDRPGGTRRHRGCRRSSSDARAST